MENEAVKLEDRLVMMRELLSPLIESVQKEADDRPRCGAEIMLALRHLQDARMRLGVALTMEQGKDPWKS